MSNTARKARKRAGVKFERTPKVATPVTVRQDFLAKSEGRQERIAASFAIKLTTAMREQLAALRPAKGIRTPRNYSR